MSLSRLLFMMLVALVFAGRNSAYAQTPDRERYCLATGDNVVVYIDTTTPYDEVDKSALVDGIDRLFESLDGGERFVIRTIRDSFPNSRVLIDACIPVCEDPSFLGDLFGPCTEGVVINDHRSLRRDIVVQIKTLLAGFEPTEHSEILRTLAMSAATESRRGQRNRLYIFSDLIENSEYMPGRVFFSEPNPALMETVRRDRLIPDIRDAVVRVFGVGRGGTVERRPLSQPMLLKLSTFWQAFFTEAGATVSIRQSWAPSTKRGCACRVVLCRSRHTQPIGAIYRRFHPIGC